MALAGLLSSVVMNGLISHSNNRADFVKKEWGCYLIATISGIVALIFFTAALYMGLQMVFTAAISALMTGLALSVISLGAIYFGTREEKKHPQPLSWLQNELESANIKDDLTELLANVEQPIKDNPGTAVLLATLAGFLTADRMH